MTAIDKNTLVLLFRFFFGIEGLIGIGCEYKSQRRMNEGTDTKKIYSSFRVDMKDSSNLYVFLRTGDC